MFFTLMQIQLLPQSQPSFTGLAAHMIEDTAPEARILPTMIITSISVTPWPLKKYVCVYILYISMRVYTYTHLFIHIYMYVYNILKYDLKLLSVQTMQQGKVERC